MRISIRNGGKNMRNRILITSIVMVCILSLTGLAGPNGNGGGCPDRNSLGQHTQPYNYLTAGNTIENNEVTYLLNTYTKTGASIIGYCVYPTPGFTGSNDDLEPLYAGWEASFNDNNKKDYFGFIRDGGQNNIPIDGETGIEIGEADYIEDDKVPTSEVVLFHINDPEECDPDETCWRRPGRSPPPVPELSTIALVSAGISGLFLVSRRYSRK